MSDGFTEALSYAARLHSRQTRKRKSQPYVGHLLAVAAIVIQHGGDEEEAIAALLHDAVEDQGGMPRLDEIRRKFGARVARIVDGCTDAYTNPKPPWKERKPAYVERVAHQPDDVRLVSAADKLANAREILSDLRVEGDSVFRRFTGAKEATLWYYRTLVEVFREAGSNPLIEELARVREPIIRNFRSELDLKLHEVQSVESTMATDPISGKVLKVEVSFIILK